MKNCLQSRISYLHRAATYLANPTLTRETVTRSPKEIDDKHIEECHNTLHLKNPSRLSSGNGELSQPARNSLFSSDRSAVSRQLLVHAQAISLKGQIRLAPEIKHSICKRCDLLLKPGFTAKTTIQNRSRGRKKSWADVQVIGCKACGTAKRFPVGQARQLKRNERRKALQSKA